MVHSSGPYTVDWITLNGSDVTRYPDNSTDNRTMATSALFITGGILISLIDCIAIFANSVILITILGTQHLRERLTYFFLVNLCVVDLLCATLCLPPAMACFVNRTCMYSEAACRLWGFASSVFMYVSVLTIGVLSVERYYSISAPMRHAAQMTLGRTLVVIGCVWMLAFIAAIMGWNGYRFSHSTYMCSVGRDSDGYMLFILTLCFVCPGSLMLVTNFAIWRVVKRTASRVHPGSYNSSSEPTVGTADTLVSGTPISIEVTSNSGNNSGQTPPTSIPSVSGAVPLQRTSCPTNTYHGVSSAVVFGVHQPRASHWKAVRTIALVLIVFCVHWVPYCAMNIMAATKKPAKLPPNAEIVITWLAMSSYAVNPFIYGWRNCAIRDAMRMACDALGARLLKRESHMEPAPNEDFFQFLERTATNNLRVSSRSPDESAISTRESSSA